MKIKDHEGWKKWQENNQDPYGSAVFRYAERWADMMEACMVIGESVADCAKSTSHAADTEGITGFMYNCAVQILFHCWEHGDDLRRWHNLDVQLGDEGEKANQSGGVLNSAILNIGRTS